jgi:hypothetical protein
MARRSARIGRNLLLLAVAVGTLTLLAVKLFDAVGFVWPITVVATMLIGFVAFRVIAKRRRLTALMEKYHDREIVEKILRQSIWVGQTAEQLVDALGHPADIDEKVLKTKRKTVWKYGHKGGNRYGLRVVVEDNLVVGWDERLS